MATTGAQRSTLLFSCLTRLTFPSSPVPADCAVRRQLPEKAASTLSTGICLMPITSPLCFIRLCAESAIPQKILSRAQARIAAPREGNTRLLLVRRACLGALPMRRTITPVQVAQQVPERPVMRGPAGAMEPGTDRTLFGSYSDNAFIETESWEQLKQVLTGNGGAYGLYGPRGSGKTWLMKRTIQWADDDSGVGLWFPCPSSYDTAQCAGCSGDSDSRPAWPSLRCCCIAGLRLPATGLVHRPGQCGGRRRSRRPVGRHRDALDGVAPGRRVWLGHTSSHMGVASSAILADGIELGLDLGISTGFGDDWLRIGPVKIYLLVRPRTPILCRSRPSHWMRSPRGLTAGR
jgi:hypothetical protein